MDLAAPLRFSTFRALINDLKKEILTQSRGVAEGQRKTLRLCVRLPAEFFAERISVLLVFTNEIGELSRFLQNR